MVAWCHTNGLLRWCGSSDVEYLFFLPRLGYGVSPRDSNSCCVSSGNGASVSYSFLHRLVALARTTSLLCWYTCRYLSYGLEPWAAGSGRTTAFPFCMMWVFSGFSACEYRSALSIDHNLEHFSGSRTGTPKRSRPPSVK